MQLFSITLFSILVSFCSVGQEHNISLIAGRNRLDYLSGIQYSFLQKQQRFSGGVEFGISRTFGQGRWNPRLSAGYGYDFLHHDRFSVGPLVQYAHSWLRVSKNPSSTVHYNEMLGGYFFEFGDKWKLVHQMLIGAMTEGFKSQLNQKKEVFWSTGYYASIGIKYRL